MSLEALIEMTRGKYKNRAMPYMRYVKDWWPKPKIRIIQEKYWGDKFSNHRGILRKYECYSFSYMGFSSGGYHGVQTNPKLPCNVCLAYGETPEQAYNQWCEIFNVWNKKEDWV